MNSNEDLYENAKVLLNELQTLKKQIEEEFWKELLDTLNSITSSTNVVFEMYTGKNHIRGLKSVKHNTYILYIIRDDNLYYQIKNIPKDRENQIKQYINYKNKDWKYIMENEERINMHKGNNEFWKLGKKNFRQKIIQQTVVLVQKTMDILNIS